MHAICAVSTGCACSSCAAGWLAESCYHHRADSSPAKLCCWSELFHRHQGSIVRSFFCQLTCKFPFSRVVPITSLDGFFFKLIRGREYRARKTRFLLSCRTNHTIVMRPGLDGAILASPAYSMKHQSLVALVVGAYCETGKKAAAPSATLIGLHTVPRLLSTKPHAAGHMGGWWVFITLLLPRVASVALGIPHHMHHHAPAAFVNIMTKYYPQHRQMMKIPSCR